MVILSTHQTEDVRALCNRVVVMNRGVSPSNLFLLDLLFAVAVIGGITAITGKSRALLVEVRALENDWVWLAAAMICSTAGGLAIFKAIDSKNATLASLIVLTSFRSAGTSGSTSMSGSMPLAWIERPEGV